MLIKRDKYLNDLVARQNNGMIEVVTGVRRCGKTYLVFELFARHLLDSGVDAGRIIPLAQPGGLDCDGMRDMPFGTRRVPVDRRLPLRGDVHTEGFEEIIPRSVICDDAK